MNEDRSWMYQKFSSDGTIDARWCNGVLQFVEYAFNNRPTVLVREGKDCIYCPCKGCQNIYITDRPTVTKHLLSTDFCPNYLRWTEHGEGYPNRASSSSALNENQQRMEKMLMNMSGHAFNWDDSDVEQQPNPEAAKFFSMLAANEVPLWEIKFEGDNTIKCENHTVLSVVIKCLSLKAEHQMSQKCFNGMMEIFKSVLPKSNKLPENFYQVKRLVQGLVMDYEKIDVCPNFCMLYYKDRANKDRCDECKEERYEPPSHKNSKKRVPKKILRYLPIAPRLQRLYMTRANAEHMRWHKEGIREKPNIMVHPADGEDWKQFD
jgi:Transposase-associated domain